MNTRGIIVFVWTSLLSPLVVLAVGYLLEHGRPGFWFSTWTVAAALGASTGLGTALGSLDRKVSGGNP